MSGSNFLANHEVFHIDTERMTIREVRATVPDKTTGVPKPLRLMKDGLIEKAYQWLSDEKNQSIADAVYMLGTQFQNPFTSTTDTFSLGVSVGRLIALNEINLSIEHSVMTEADMQELKETQVEMEQKMFENIRDWADKMSRKGRHGDDSDSEA